MSTELKIRSAATVASLALLAALIVQVSAAAFKAEATSPESSWQAGGLNLALDNSVSAMFQTTGMLPGDEVDNCIEVTYSGTVTDSLAPVKLHAVTGGDLAPYLNLTLEIGTGGEFDDCTGFTPSSTLFTGTLASWSHTNYGNGLAAWTPSTSEEVRVFKLTVELDSATPEASAGDTGTAEITWEIQTA